MILSQDSTPEVRSTWLTRKAPSSAWLGTASRKEPCMAFMKEKLSPDISRARVAISEEAYWPMPPRSRAVCAARASPAVHQSGRLIPSVPARRRLAEEHAGHLAETMVHLGDLHQVAHFLHDDGIDPIVGAPEALRGHRLEGGQAGEQGNRATRVPRHILVG